MSPCTVPSSPGVPWSRVERHIRCGFGKDLRNIAAHVDARHAVALGLQRIGDAIARHEADRSFARPAAHKDRDLEFGEVIGRPTALDFPLQINARSPANLVAHRLAQHLDLFARGIARVDQELRLRILVHRPASCPGTRPDRPVPRPFGHLES